MEQTVRKARATFDGIVISDKNDKTITVLVETYKRHKIYGKRVKYRKNITLTMKKMWQRRRLRTHHGHTPNECP